ncbi:MULTISPECIES: UPF0489 family protein [Paenibacillus]|uniref:UPF0489 family protein n=1 Tax=Paenibacillus vandeheii TaxID=3035917 RepID=A0ABT8JHI3_9BACL|nr:MULTISPECIES: UPF0489 family protein [Paenibacillus]KGP78390.1 hypothetical protein P363_0132255 [Paenibacillus sp. MAEPY1]KGP78435.1 hypothetical protein P364_0128780 [Paenibacillus sp. MAEPY2]MDN4604006.1 UPF0489 family protein [Paenibacillus vandeheii]
MLSEGDFSNLRIENILGKMIYVFDKHHFALPVWALTADKNKRPYNLISFDYHTDTVAPFNKYAFRKVYEDKMKSSTKDEFQLANEIISERILKVDTDDLSSLLNAVKDLEYDEHITTAHELAIINEYHVINKSDSIAMFKGEHLYTNDSLSYEIGEIESNSCVDDNYIEQTGFKIPEKPYILDFDLDYFPKRSSFSPERSSFLRQIIENAEIITIARERECFDDLKLEEFEVDEAEKLLLNFIAAVLEEPK